MLGPILPAAAGPGDGTSHSTTEASTTKKDSAKKVPSQRFITTSRSGQDLILSQRHLLGDRHSIAKKLQEQKINNTKTNLTFGFDPVIYETDAMSVQKDVLKEGKVFNKNRKAEHAALKKALQRTCFSLGTDTPDYLPVSTLPDPTGHIAEFTGQLNTEVKNLIKKSNLYFGGDEPIYQSSESQMFQYRGEGVDFDKRKKEISAMKRALTATTFTLGQDPVVYNTQYRETFNNGAVQAMNPEERSLCKKRSQDIKKDLRHCHYALGHDPADYQTTMMRQFEVPDLAQHAKDREAYVENARVLKKELVRSHIDLGTDDAYL